MASFTVRAHPHSSDLVSIARRESCDATSRLIHRQDADPEHRFTEYRLAAAWFANAPSPVQEPSTLALAAARALEDRGLAFAAALIRAANEDQELYDRFIGPMIDQLENSVRSTLAEL